MNKSGALISKRQSQSLPYPQQWPKLGGLQARMTFSYVWVTALFVLLVEILVSFLFILFINFSGETSNFALARRIGVQYAYAASLQSDGLVLNPRSTFLPGQPYSLMPPGELVAGENARRTFDLINMTIPYVTERNPAQPPFAIALLITPDGRVVSSSYPSRYPAGMSFSRLLPHQTAAVAQALRGVSIYAKTLPETIYVVETIWGKHGQPIGALYIQGEEGPIGFPDVLQFVYNDWFVLTIIVLLFLVVTTPIGSLFSLLTTRGLVRRIRRLATATTRFADGDYSQRVSITRKDEVGQMELQFNRMAEQLIESIARQKELSEQNARMAERARISRELHDAISQDLFSLRMLAYGLQEAFPAEASFQELRTHIVALGETTTRTIREMRALLLELRPTQLENLGLAEALKQLAATYSERLAISVKTNIASVSLNAQAEHTLLRIAQEALSNAVRHGHATEITLELAEDEQGVRLMVADNGKGFVFEESQQQRGLGLHLMQERIRELGGTFALHSEPGQGTEITIKLRQEQKDDSGYDR